MLIYPKRKGVKYMQNDGIVTIHGKDYMTVAKRLELAHKDNLDGVDTEVLHHDPVVVKATVTVKGKSFTGISAVSLDTASNIERQNPYEVAETSAVGRALGFAGFGVIESIASADEMDRAITKRPLTKADQVSFIDADTDLLCEICGKPARERKGTSRTGKSYHGIFCTTEDRTHTRWLSA